MVSYKLWVSIIFLGYLEEGPLWFIDFTKKLELTIEFQDNNQPITNSEDEKARKKLEYIVKKKAWCDYLYAFV